MQIRYKVHSATPTAYEVTATLADGSVVPATVQGFVVEIVSDDGAMSHTLRFGPAQAADAAALFTPDAAITVNFEKDA